MSLKYASAELSVVLRLGGVTFACLEWFPCLEAAIVNSSWQPLGILGKRWSLLRRSEKITIARWHASGPNTAVRLGGLIQGPGAPLRCRDGSHGHSAGADAFHFSLLARVRSRRLGFSPGL